MSEYIKRLITGGEHQTLDFKYEVSDFRKIARTLVAFSNTDGGRLLIGVKDNGAIAGIRSEEEYFMIDGAARLYCRPEISFRAREWQVEGRKVMEVTVEKGKLKPYKAQDEEHNWIAYIRQKDQNFKAHKLLLKIWELEKSGRQTTVHFRQAESILLSYLETYPTISVSKYRRLAGLSSSQAEKILVDFTMLGIIKIDYLPSHINFILAEGYQKIIEGLEI